jgi:hypothetical protein
MGNLLEGTSKLSGKKVVSRAGVINLNQGIWYQTY